MYIVCKYNSCEEMFNSFSKLNWWSPNSEQLRWLLRNVVQLSLKFRAGGTCSVRGALPFQMILAITYSKPSSLNDILLLHNGGNDSHKRQFLALGVRSQSWKLNNLSKKKFLSNWLVLQAACYNLTEIFFAQIISVSSIKRFQILESR